jgi:cell division protein YceG involved in septum cleavage
MQSESELGNELGTIKYVSELSGWDPKDVANIFILLIIFVFDPLAIMLVITTNQAFHNLKPKLVSEEPTIEPIEPISDKEQILNNLERERQQVINSGMSFLAKGKTLQDIQEQIDRVKTY